MLKSLRWFRYIVAAVSTMYGVAACAQVPNTAAGYIFSAASGTYTPLSGGTGVPSIQTDDFTTQNIPIGFTFPFAGSTYTQLSACSNGWLSLANTNPTAAASRDNTTGNMGIIAPMLMPLWDDLNGAYSTSGSGVASYLTTGTSPSRVFTFEWSGWKWIWTGSGDNVISYQVKLYESGRIEFIYKQGPDAVNPTAAATIGIAKSGTDYQSLNNSGTTPTSSTTVFTDVIASRPANGQTYIWDIPCATPTGLASSNITNTGAVITWTAVANSQGYEYVVSTSATPPSGPGTFTSSTSLALTGLLNGTQYYVFVRNKCSANSFSSWVSINFTTIGCIKPTNLLISNVIDTAADVLWSKMPDADFYDYAADFSSLAPVSGIKSTTGITANLSGLIPNSKYYFHLRSRCFGMDSSAWKLDSFITQFVCYAPQVQVNYLGTNTPYAFWSPVPSAIAYEYVLTHVAYPKPAFGKEITTTFVSLSLPDDGLDYYLNVRTKCNSMFTSSVWSTVALRTGTTGIAGAGTSQDIMNIYPNPVADELHIQGASGRHYGITDVTGRQLVSGTCYGADYKVSTTGLAPGIYLVHLTGAGAEGMFRFVKQ